MVIRYGKPLIIVMGDVHGDWGSLNEVLNSHPNIAMVLQCGDFGWWPRVSSKYLPRPIAIKNKKVKILWCDGNHEDFEEIKQFKDSEILPNVFYMERGSIAELPDKRKILFIGGGLSIDRKDRIQRSGDYGWFEEETISQKDIEELPDEKIDIVISHTAPESFKLIDYHNDGLYPKDPSRKALDYVLEKYRPKLWYFGHMHKFQMGKYKDCTWIGLSAAGFGDRWWIPLDEGGI